jgi:hypothetical protein
MYMLLWKVLKDVSLILFIDFVSPLELGSLFYVGYSYVFRFDISVSYYGDHFSSLF